eukprot:354181-Chlamydomonas_euryale.AAC.3
MLRRLCQNFWPSDQFSVARQCVRVPIGGVSTRAFLMAPPDCRVLHARKIFDVLVTMSQLQSFHAAIFSR